MLITQYHTLGKLKKKKKEVYMNLQLYSKVKGSDRMLAFLLAVSHGNLGNHLTRNRECTRYEPAVIAVLFPI